MKKIAYLSILFLLSACCSSERYKDILESRVGMSEDELIQEIGNPTSVYDTKNKRSLEYSYSNTFCNQYGCSKDWCTTQYILNDEKVEYWKYNGNDCCVSVGVFDYWFGK